MSDTVISRLQTLAFSYREMGDMGFNALFTEDYLEQIENIRLVANETDSYKELIDSNTARLDTVEPIVDSNTDRLDTVELVVADNVDRLDIVEPIAAANAAAIALASGQLVGNQDFATDSVGGVVLLASLIADLTQITTADLAAAPVAYDQAYTQLAANLDNENKAKINEIVLKINAIIAGQITSKQMSSS